MNKKIVLLLLIGCVLSLTSCRKTQKEFMEDYPGLTDKNHLFKYTTANEVITLLEDNYSGLIMFGFKSCPWCQAAIAYANEIAKEKGFEVIYYLDIKEMRNNTLSSDHQKYLKILNLIKEGIGNPDKIYAPTVICLKNGEVTGYNVATVPGHEYVDNVLPAMTSEQIEELRNIYRNIFVK